jgi:hypothetical protein
LPDIPGLVANRPDPQRAALEFLRHEGEDQGHADPGVNVTIPGGPVTITESAEALFTAIAPRKQLFYRGGVVVELVNEGEGYTVQVLDAVAAQSRFEKYVRFYKNTRVGNLNMPTPTTISETTAKQYLRSEACRTLLPNLNGVLHCPLLVEKDGRLHGVDQGYDDETGFFVASAQRTETVQVGEAVELLSGLLNDFDFVTPGDRSRAIALPVDSGVKAGRVDKGACASGCGRSQCQPIREDVSAEDDCGPL